MKVSKEIQLGETSFTISEIFIPLYNCFFFFSVRGNIFEFVGCTIPSCCNYAFLVLQSLVGDEFIRSPAAKHSQQWKWVTLLRRQRNRMLDWVDAIKAPFKNRLWNSPFYFFPWQCERKSLCHRKRMDKLRWCSKKLSLSTESIKP